MRGAGKIAKNRSQWPGGLRDKALSRQYLGSTQDVKGLARKGFQTYLGLEALGEMSPNALERVQEDTSPMVIPPEGGTPGPWNEFNPYNIKQIKQELKKSREKGESTIDDKDNEDVVITHGNEGSNAAAGEASVSAANDPDSESIQSDSVSRVNAYKDIIRQFIGSGNEGERMQKAALLMNIGGMMMAGRSDDPGMQGFVDIIGQTALQTAPMLFEMGAEKSKAEREIGQAALQLYISQLDDDKRTGDFVAVWDNVYDLKDGEIQYDRFSGAPIIKGRNLVSQFKSNSKEIDQFLDMNNTLGYPRFTFQPSSGTGAGLFGITSPGGADAKAYLLSDAQRDQMTKFSEYLRRPLTAMATTIMPMMIEGRDSLIGYKGGFGRMFGGAAYLATDIAKMVTEGFGEDAMMKTGENTYAVSQTGELGKFYNQLLGIGPEGTEYNSINAEGEMNDEGIKGMAMAVLEAPTEGVFEEVPGLGDMPVYVDRTGKYGVKGAQYLTRTELAKALFDPRKSQLEIFETTLGLMLARSRQPTGRMLADVLRRSFAETQMTSILDYASNNPEAVIGKYMGLYNEIYTNMSGALNLAGFVKDENSITRMGQTPAPKSFYISGSKEMAQQYYTMRDWEMRKGNPLYNTFGHDILGIDIPAYSDQSWRAGNEAVIGADNMEKNKNLEETVDYYTDLFNQ